MKCKQGSQDALSILVVEDDKAASEFLTRLIVKQFPDCIIHLAENGRVGVELFKEQKPDIVITDINMPVMDGIQMAGEIRALDAGAHIIAATAKSDTQNLLEAIKVGINRYVLKPINIKKLFEAMDDCIARITMNRQIKVQNDLIRKLSLAVEQSTNMIIIANSRGAIEYVNPIFTAFTGYTPAEVAGQSLRVLLTDSTPLDTFEMLWSTITRGLKWNGEFAIRNKGGDLLCVEASISPLATEEENGTHFVAVVQDISERKRAEKALHASKTQLMATIQSIADGILAVDNTGKVLLVNPRFCELWRVPKALMEGNYNQILQDFFLDQLADADLHLRQTRLYNESNSVGMDILAFKDGRVFERYTNPIITSGTVTGRVWSFHDVTERMQAESEKAKLENQLQHAQKLDSVGRLAGGVAHDFNNMLGVILGHVNLALMDLDSTQPFYINLTEIQKAAERSADLTRQLLAFARKQTITPKMVNINEVAAGMLNMLQRIIGEDVNLNWKLEEGVWPIKVDPSQLDQILANLCVNARDSIDDIGKITIETGNIVIDEEYSAGYEGFAPGEYVRLTVSDNGCGMDKETLALIFEPFFTTKGAGKGTGLGLATVYGAVKQNNGFIYVFSEPGMGTTFSVFLPRYAGEVQQVPEGDEARPAQRGHETILLVEDEPAILKVTIMILTRQGYTVLAADSPGAAIDLARENAGKISLLLTDVIMPEMNGRDLAKELLSRYPDMKRLFMSGFTADVIANHGAIDEGVHFIQKPFSVHSLSAKVREVLDSGNECV